jgi:hypothetical protein
MTSELKDDQRLEKIARSDPLTHTAVAFMRDELDLRISTLETMILENRNLIQEMATKIDLLMMTRK